MPRLPGVVVDKEREKRSDRRFDVGEGEVIEEIAGPVKEVTLEMCQAFSGPHKNYHNDVEAARKLGISGHRRPRDDAALFHLGDDDQSLRRRLVRGRADEREPGECALARRYGDGAGRCPRGRRRKVRDSRAQLQVWCEKADGTKVVVGSASAITRRRVSGIMPLACSRGRCKGVLG